MKAFCYIYPSGGHNHTIAVIAETRADADKYLAESKMLKLLTAVGKPVEVVAGRIIGLPVEDCTSSADDEIETDEYDEGAGS